MSSCHPRAPHALSAAPALTRPMRRLTPARRGSSSFVPRTGSIRIVSHDRTLPGTRERASAAWIDTCSSRRPAHRSAWSSRSRTSWSWLVIFGTILGSSPRASRCAVTRRWRFFHCGMRRFAKSHAATRVPGTEQVRTNVWFRPSTSSLAFSAAQAAHPVSQGIRTRDRASLQTHAAHVDAAVGHHYLVAFSCRCLLLCFGGSAGPKRWPR